MTPVIFAYGGWQTSSFLAGEIRDAPKILPRAIVLGVLAVIAVYVSINFVYLRVLGPSGLAASTKPASSVMLATLGDRGATIIAAGISFSAFGFLGQSILTAPRVYFAMAQDGVFFRSVAAFIRERAFRFLRLRCKVCAPSRSRSPALMRRWSTMSSRWTAFFSA